MDAFGPTQMSVRNQERERRSVGQGGSSGAESTIRHALPRNRRDIRPKPRCNSERARDHYTFSNPCQCFVLAHALRGFVRV